MATGLQQKASTATIDHDTITDNAHLNFLHYISADLINAHLPDATARHLK